MGKLNRTLPEKRKDEFTLDVPNLSDVELAHKYKLSERTAVNWRLKLYGKRKRLSE